MRREVWVVLAMGMLLSPLLNAFADGKATVYSGGQIYTRRGVPPVEAVVVKGGTFIHTGSLESALSAAGADCEHVELGERMMMPSFFEAHAHPNMGSLLDLRDYPYAESLPTPEEYVAHIRAYLVAHPDTQVLRGTGWDSAIFPDAAPDRALLDRVSSEIPIFLRSFDQHSAWVNTKALEMGDITRDTVAPEGQIVRDETGEPSGTLREEMTVQLDSALPPMSVEENKALVLKYQEMAHRLGFTGNMCAMVLPNDNLYAAYRELLRDGELAMYTQLAFFLTPDTYQDGIQWIADEAARCKANGPSELLGFELAKFYMDGAILGQTAYLLEDYASKPGFRGEPNWSTDLIQLRDAFRLCDESGLRSHIHAVGDGAVRLALDGLEALQLPNRHAITHVELVDPPDFARFREMGILATINPYWFCKSTVWDHAELMRLGRARSERMLPAKSFYEAGVTVAAASDYPVSHPDPLAGIEMAVTRTLIEPWRGGRTAEACTLNPAEAISLDQAVDAFTLQAAYAYGLEAKTGSIEAGKSADFVLLDRSIISGAPSEARVLETWFQGKQVYRSE